MNQTGSKAYLEIVTLVDTDLVTARSAAQAKMGELRAEISQLLGA
ncbi:hypothetical protein [Actinosynnema sp. ALI-1.44]|nr:hypothetical protein [Actinosynnema sp. ALI-1.44]